MKKSPLFTIAAFVLTLGILALMPVKETKANPSKLTVCTTDPEFATTSPTHVSTTTLNYMRAGTATTTLPCLIEQVDQIDLFILFRASSTASTLRWRYEYSRDGSDWYLGQEEFIATEATSTVRVPSTYTEYSLAYASTSPDTSQGYVDTILKRVQVKDLSARYMRVKFYLPVGSSNGAVYAEMLRKEQFR